MSNKRRYTVRDIPINCNEPLQTVAQLASSTTDSPYVVYEGEETWHYAAGIAAEVILTAEKVQLLIGNQVVDSEVSDDLISGLEAALSGIDIENWRAFGWTAFELAYLSDTTSDLQPQEILLRLMVPKVEVIIGGGRACIRTLSDIDAENYINIINTPPSARCNPPRSLSVKQRSYEGYLRNVASAVSDIRANKLQKVILSRTEEVDFEVDLIATYVLGRKHNTPRRSFLLNLGGIEAAGFSPETVLEVDQTGCVSTQPLAGTRARYEDASLNERLISELLTDPKEIFEHAISVKLAFQEMSEICEANTVSVTEFMEVQARGSVQHLGSRLTGHLRSGLNSWHAFWALFPAVTVSGIPKNAAFSSIRHHETSRRGLYSGAVLTIEENGSLDAAVVLRAVYRQSGHTWLRAGAGIVADSRPERELEETCEKLRSIATYLVPDTNRQGTHQTNQRPWSDENDC